MELYVRVTDPVLAETRTGVYRVRTYDARERLVSMYSDVDGWFWECDKAKLELVQA